MRRLAVFLVTAVAITACGSPGPGAVPTDDLDMIVAPDEDGSFPPDLSVTCDHGVFPLGALQDIRPVEQADPEIAEAMAPFLGDEEGRHWPQDGWQVLYQDEGKAHVVTLGDEKSLAHIYLSNEGSGWEWSGASQSDGPCELKFMTPDGLNTVDWTFDPEAPTLSADSTEVHVLLNELECIGGQEIGARLVGPQVVMTETQVFVAFAAEPPGDNDFTCPGNPDTPYVVELPAALGDRMLLEGARLGITLEDYVD